MRESQSVEVPTDLIDAYRHAIAEASRYETIAKEVRALIEAAMGDAEYATVNGNRVVRWMTVKSRRLDTALLRHSVDPVILAGCYVDGVSRRFIPLSEKAETQP